MKLTDMIVSAALKRGVVYEGRNVEADIHIPDTELRINVKIEHMKVTISKEVKEEA